MDREYLVEKTTQNILKTRFLQSIFPESAFIIVFRHPIALAYATKMKKQKRNLKIESLVGEYINMLQARSARSAIPSEMLHFALRGLCEIASRYVERNLSVYRSWANPISGNRQEGYKQEILCNVDFRFSYTNYRISVT